MTAQPSAQNAHLNTNAQNEHLVGRTNAQFVPIGAVRCAFPLGWSDAGAQAAIAAALARIELAYPQDVPIGLTWGDQVLADLEERANVAAIAHDNVVFDEALRRYEAYVVSRYCTPSAVEMAS